MQDLYNGDITYVWEDYEIIFISSSLNAITFSMPKLEFLKFVSELNKAAVKATELQKEKFEKER